jgi:hypothetical protein
VKIDRNLINSIARNNPELAPGHFSNTVHNIRINLMKLVYATGTVQTRRTKPTRFQKLTEKSDLLDYIRDCNDFCIRKHEDADKQISLSEDFGVGLSVLVADHFYRINWSTLGKPQRTSGYKSDIKCMSKTDEEIRIEAKGSTNRYMRSCQKTLALNQKNNPSTANVSVASCALLNENSISDVDFSDPPFIPPEDARYEKSLLKADHYARTFNLIGQNELSKYFNLMRQRIIHDRDFARFYEKQELFDKMKKEYIRIKMEKRSYLGSIEKLDKSSFIFTGIDESLLSVSGFIEFNGYEEKHIEEKGNNFHIFSDGLCVAVLKDISFLAEQIRYEQIPHYYDSFSIIDSDYSKESTIIDFLSYLFEKVGCETRQYPSFNEVRFDLLVSYKDKRILVEVKKHLTSKNINFIIDLMSNVARLPWKLILVTNSKVDTFLRQLLLLNNITLIDRIAFDNVIRHNELALTYIMDIA